MSRLGFKGRLRCVRFCAFFLCVLCAFACVFVRFFRFPHMCFRFCGSFGVILCAILRGILYASMHIDLLPKPFEKAWNTY